MEKYKFKELRTFISDEWMVNLTKKYRKVFDKAETAYVYCELSFYNKSFDRENWNATVTLKCFEETRKTELCSLETFREIKSNENIVSIRDGWGHPQEGAYWPRGNYYWEAYIDNELVGEIEFAINDIGRVTAENNPYFDVESIKAYIGDIDAYEKTERKYVKEIMGETTQYVWVELKLKNKMNAEWHYELFFNFFDNTHRMKGQVIREGIIPSGKADFLYTFDAGWGNNVPGSWKSEKYFIEVVFMETKIAQLELDCRSAKQDEIPKPLYHEEAPSVKGLFNKLINGGRKK